MKKILLIILSILILIGGAVGLFFGLKDKDAERLNVKIYGLTVKVGHGKAIEYECANANAIINFEIENENIAQVEYVSNIPTIIGVSAGTTKITIIAKYKKFSNKVSATVTVTNGDEEEVANVSLIARSNAAVDENEVTCTRATNAYVSFVVDNIDVTSWSIATEDSNIEVSKYDDFPQTIQILSDVAGEYVIKLTINDSHEIEINVIVNE